MADDIVKRLLIKIGLDSSEADSFLTTLQKKLDNISSAEEDRAASRKTSQAQDAAASQAQLTAARQAVDAAQQQANAIKTQVDLKQISVRAIQDEIAGEKARLDIKQSQIKIMASEGQINTEVLKQLQNEINLEKQKLALQQNQLRQASVGQPSAKTTEKEPTAEKWGLQGITRGLFGGGLLGSVAGGTLLGAGTIEIIAQLVDKVKELGRALVEASGPEQQLRQEFEYLATGKGADPTVLIEKLRVATRGLVADTDLYRVANGFMRANTGLTNDQMIALIQNTTNLARATGGQGGADAAMAALTKTFQSGRPQILAHVAGLTNLQAVLRQIPAGVSPAVRQLMEFQLVSEAMAKAVAKIQVPMTTLPELMTQVSVASKNFIGEVASGILQSNGFGNSIETISNKLMAMQPELEKIAKTVGTDLGNALKFVVDHWGELKIAMETVVAIKAFDWALDMTHSFVGMASAIRKASIELGLFSVAETAAGAGGKAGLAEKVGKTLPGIGWGLGKLMGAGAGTAEAATAVETGAGVTAGTAAAPVALAGAAAGGLGYAAMKENDLSIEQAKEGIKEIIKEFQEWNVEAGKTAVTLDSKVGAALKKFTATMLNSFLPGWRSVWDQATKYADDALNGLGTAAEQAFKSVINDTIFGKIAQVLKAASLKAEAAKPMTVGSGTIAAGLAQYAPPPPPPQAPVGEDDETINQRRKLAQLELQIKETELKSELDLKKQYVSMEEEANKASYEAGLESFEQYQAKQRALLLDGFNAEKNEILAIADLKKKQIASDALQGRGKVPLTSIEQAEVQKKQDLVDAQAQQQIFQANAGLLQKQSALTLEALQQQQAAYKIYANEVVSILKTSYEEQEKLLEESFKNGELSANTYVSIRKTLIEQEAEAEKKALDDELANSKLTAGEIADIRIKQVQISVDAEKKLTELTENEEELRIQAAKNTYDQQLKILEAEQKAAQFNVKTGQGGTGAGRSNVQDLRELIALDNQYIGQLKEIADGLEPGTKEWMEVVDEIEKAKAAQQEYNQKLREMQDFATPLAKVFGTIAESLNGATGGLGKFSKELAEMSSMMNRMAQLSKEIGPANGGMFGLKGLWGNTFGSKPQTPTLPTVKQTPQDVAAAQFTVDLKQSGQQAQTWANEASQAAKNLSTSWQTQIQQMLQATQNFVSGVNSAVNRLKSGSGETPGGVAPTGPNLSPVQTEQNAPGSVPDFIPAPTASSSNSATSQATQKLATDLTTAGQDVNQWGGSVVGAGKAFVTGWTQQAQAIAKVTQALVASVQQAAQQIAKAGQSSSSGGGGDDGSESEDSGGGDDTSAVEGITSAASSSSSSNSDAMSAADQQMITQTQSLGTNFQKMNAQSSDWQTNMGQFIQGISKAVAGVGMFAQSLSGILNNSKNAASGAGKGALSMGMTGLSIGGQFGGPYGAAIGAAAGVVVGGIMGGIVGAKQQQVNSEVTKIQTQLKSITDQLNAGTISMGSAIQQLQQERATAVSELGGSKKGQKQLATILPALNDQIEQLVQQQQQILQQLNQQLAEVMAPEGYSEIMDSLDQIISKYQQFASAAQGNTAAVTQANQFLIASLQQYAQTLGDQVNQAEQSAISDALQLIQLQQEAADMQNKLAEQNFGILTQGVMARQQSTAQTKGQEIEANDEQYNQQMTQLNQEMALTQFKVTAQEKIFGLATDQNDLEAQMLSLQEAAATEQYKQVAAEVAALSELTNALAGGGAGLPGGLFNAVGGIDMQAILQLLGLGSGGTGSSQLNNVPATYEEYFSALQNTAYSGIESQLTAAAATPFGSSQRSSVEQELMSPGVLKVLQDAGLVASNPQTDPNWINFANWIMNQAQAQPSYDVGGIVPEDQTATVHQGEYIMPNDLVSQFITGMQSFAQAVSQFIGNTQTLTGNSTELSRQETTGELDSKPDSSGIAGQIGQTVATSIQAGMATVVTQIGNLISKVAGLPVAAPVASPVSGGTPVAAAPVQQTPAPVSSASAPAPPSDLSTFWNELVKYDPSLVDGLAQALTQSDRSAFLKTVLGDIAKTGSVWGLADYPAFAQWVNGLPTTSGNAAAPKATTSAAGPVQEVSSATASSGKSSGGAMSVMATALDKLSSTITGLMQKAGSSIVNSFVPSAASSLPQGNLNSSMLGTHQQIFDLASQRVAMETTLLSAQQQQTVNDMQRLTLLNTIVDKITSAGTGGGVNSFEGGLLQVYQQRGRYGSAGFRRSQL